MHLFHGQLENSIHLYIVKFFIGDIGGMQKEELRSKKAPSQGNYIGCKRLY